MRSTLLLIPTSSVLVACGGGAGGPLEETGQDTSLFADIRHADWSPDGDRFVVTRAMKDGGDVVIMDREGHLLDVVAATDATELTAHWSPTDSRVAYSRQDQETPYSLWVGSADGMTVPQRVGPQFPVMFGRWSPDGESLVFNSVGGEGRRQVFVAKADGSGARELTSHEEGHSDYPSWSPDGQWVLFESDRGGTWDTYRIRTDGSSLEQITTGGSSAPRYAPDGSAIAFHDVRNGSDFDLFLIDDDGENEHVLFSGPGDQRLPEWSPDGSTIAFISNAGGHHDLFEIEVASGAVRQVTHQPEGELFDVLLTQGVVAAQARLDQLVRMVPAPLLFRDSDTALRHARWLAADGSGNEAQFLLQAGMAAFPSDEGIQALADSLSIGGS